jgi:hypothetical protein
MEATPNAFHRLAAFLFDWGGYFLSFMEPISLHALPRILLSKFRWPYRYIHVLAKGGAGSNWNFVPVCLCVHVAESGQLK